MNKLFTRKRLVIVAEISNTNIATTNQYSSRRGFENLATQNKPTIAGNSIEYVESSIIISENT